MKKIFLSLSAIAMLAVGTVSCGSDDSNDTTPPVVTPPVVANNSFVHNGVEYNLNGNAYIVQSTDGQAVDFGNYSYEDGEDAPSYVVTEWFLEAYPTTPQGEQPSHFIRILFDVEAGVNADGTPKLQTPTQAENVFPYQVITVSSGQVLSNSQYAYGQIDMDFNTFVLEGETLTTSFKGVDNKMDVKFDFNGRSGFVLENWTAPAAKNASKGDVKKRKNFLINNEELISVIRNK